MTLTRKILLGSGLMLALKFAQRLMTLASALVLARVLSPVDFATVAIASIVVQLFDRICNTGARQYIVQAEHVDDAVLNTAWSLDILTRSAAFLLVLACLPLVDSFWDNASAYYATAALAPTLLLGALVNPQLHRDVRELHFARMVRVELIRRCVSVVSVIVLAFIMRSFWAMVIATWLGVLAAVLASWWMTKYRPKLSFNGIGLQWLFSRWMVARSVVGYIRSQLDSLFVSKLYPAALFGQFTLARELTVMPATDVVSPAIEPLLSAFSRARNNPEMLHRQMRISALTIATLIAPLALYIHEYSVGIVALLLGSQWTEAGPMMQAMVPLLIGFSLGGLLNTLMISQGLMRTLFAYDLITMFLIAGLLALVGGTDLLLLIETRSVAGLLLTTGTLLFLTWRMKASVWKVFTLMVGPFFIAFLGMVFVRLVLPAAPEVAGATRLIVDGCILLFSYGTLTLVTALLLAPHSGSYRFLLDLVNNVRVRCLVALRDVRSVK